jgi:hypothetical protein
MCSTIEDHDWLSATCTGTAELRTVSPVHRSSTGVSRTSTQFRRSVNGKSHLPCSTMLVVDHDRDRAFAVRAGTLEVGEDQVSGTFCRCRTTTRRRCIGDSAADASAGGSTSSRYRSFTSDGGKASP